MPFSARRHRDQGRPFAGRRFGVGGAVCHRGVTDPHIQRGGPALPLPHGRTRRNSRPLHPGDPLSVVQDLVPFLPEAAGTRIEHPYRYTGAFWERHSYRAFPNW